MKRSSQYGLYDHNHAHKPPKRYQLIGSNNSVKYWFDSGVRNVERHVQEGDERFWTLGTLHSYHLNAIQTGEGGNHFDHWRSLGYIRACEKYMGIQSSHIDYSVFTKEVIKI